MGAGQLVLHSQQGRERKLGLVSRFPFATGRTYSRFDVVAATRSARVDVVACSVKELVERVGSGQIGAVFAGAAESGRRALGNRSIIADPRNPKSRERLNNEIKRRKPFRPFAPFVLAEKVNDWFDCPPNAASPYMSHAFPIKSEKRAVIPAVCHQDGTARIQTVHKELSPRLHDLMTAWTDATEVPVLLNTSFNDNEPIVQSPEQALNCFASTPLDFLYFADEQLLCLKRRATTKTRRKATSTAPTA